MNESGVNSVATGPRVKPRIGAAFQGVVRLMWAQQFTFSAMLPLAAGVAVLSVMTFLINRQQVGDWAETFILMTVLPILAFETGARAVREDLKPGAVDYLITRPIPRWAYVLFKYVGQLSVTLTKALLGMVVIVGLIRGLGAEINSIPLWLVGLVGGVSAFMALGFLMGTLTSRYLILGLFYAGLIEGAVGNIPIQLNKLSILRHLRELYLPGGDAAAWPSVGFLALIVMVLVGVAAGLFSTKEFIGEKGGEA
jgi:ABC-2 type transport system permease protein